MQRTTADLIAIARCLTGTGNRLFIYNTASKNTSDPIAIARVAAERVDFE